MSTNKQSRGWLLTLPADEYDAATVRAGLASWPYVGQQETGEETGYRHWQVYVESPGAIRFSTLRRAFSKGHFEQRKGTKQQAYDYCTKAETAVEGSRIESTPKIVLEESGRGARTDLTALHAMIADDGMSVDQVLLAVPSAARFVTSLRAIEQARDRAAATSLRDVRSSTGTGRLASAKPGRRGSDTALTPTRSATTGILSTGTPGRASWSSMSIAASSRLASSCSCSTSIPWSCRPGTRTKWPPTSGSTSCRTSRWTSPRSTPRRSGRRSTHCAAVSTRSATSVPILMPAGARRTGAGIALHTPVCGSLLHTPVCARRAAGSDRCSRGCSTRWRV